jgi:asparagine synthase (glutamine-hydrolysing)
MTNRDPRGAIILRFRTQPSRRARPACRLRAGYEMDRFVAFHWNAASAGQTAKVDLWSRQLASQDQRWIKVLDAPGLRIAVLASRNGQPRIAPLAGADGLIVGTLFERGKEKLGRLAQLSGLAASDILASAGEHLITHYWGDYVGLWRESPDSPLTVVHDPCGPTGCFITQADGIAILCSYVADIAALPGLSFSVDPNALRAFLIHNYFITARTGLRELQELLPGHRLTSKPGERPLTRSLWDPLALAGSPQGRSFDELREELRDIAGACFAAWGGTSGNIAVRLSGGLDSSIVANLIRRASSGRVTGIHFIGSGYEAFELKLARLAAGHAGIDLLELELGAPATGLNALLAIPKLARPTKQVHGMAADAVLTGACAALGVDCVMGGHGGDALFLQRSIAVDAFADFVRLKGVGSGFWRTAYETAVLLQFPVWTVLKGAAAYSLGRKKWSPYAFLDLPAARLDRSVLAGGDAAIPSEDMSNPWLEDARRLPPCKAEQMRSLIALRNYHPLLGHGVRLDAIHPFISQPLVEFSLRTPAFMFGDGGEDRALERRAFADLLPEAIRRRTHKGFINHQLVESIIANADALPDFILDGGLIKDGIADRAKTAQLFAPERLLAGDSLGPLQNMIAAEAWLRSWQNGAIGRTA